VTGQRGIWIRYLVATLAVLAVLGVLSAIVLTLERDSERANARTEAAERLQEALWRLDAYVVPVLGRQAGLAYSHYVPAFVPTRLYTPDGARKDTEKPYLEISPVLTTRWPSWVLLHFQAPLAGGIASPEVPEGRHLWVQKELGMKPADIAPRRELLRKLGGWLRRDLRTRLVAGSAGRQEMWARNLIPPTAQTKAPPSKVRARRNRRASAPPRRRRAPVRASGNESRARLFNRAQSTVQLPEPTGNALMNVYRPPDRGDANAPAKKTGRFYWKQRTGSSAGETQRTRAEVSDMSAAWLRSEGKAPQLILYRSATVEGKRFIQGALLDWPALRTALLAEVRELYPPSTRVELRPRRAKDPRALQEAMSTLPVVLHAQPVTQASVWAVTPVRATLLVTWALALIALLVTAAAVRGMSDLARRRMNFVSAVSHELRAPLTALRMYLDMLADGMIGSEEKRAEVLRTLQGQAERLSGLVRGVLDYARLERQTFQAHRRPLSLPDLMQQVEQACRDRCAASGTELSVRTELPEDADIETDPEAVIQIVLNLVDNGCKYAGADGKVALEVTASNESVVVQVSDDGPGIPPAARRKLFDAFYRAGSEMTREHTGVGLGLAIARGFAASIGARLELSGEPRPDGNLEARFTLSLPRATRG
jgi:signal transduction histidine kinase